MKKKYYFIQLELKNGDVRFYFSYSKRRCLEHYRLWSIIYVGETKIFSSNFVLK